MKFEAIAEIIDGIPHLPKHQGKMLYDLILRERPKNCLELGFAHGVSSCYIAAALDEIGAGHLISVDLEISARRDPPLETLLERSGLTNWVEIHREKNSYTWFLKKLLEHNQKHNNSRPALDFCFIDGPKNWTIDGFAFFAVDRIMRQNGLFLFDDFTWSYGASVREQTDGINHRELCDAQRNQPNIEAVFRLLVYPHPEYSEFEIVGEDWVLCRKIQGLQKRVIYNQSPKVKDYHKRIGFSPNPIG